MRSPPTNPILSVFRIMCLLFGTLAIFGVFFFCLLVAGRRRRRRVQRWFVHRWGKFATWSLGIRYRIHGPSPPMPALLAPNHIGYCDIPPIAAAVPTFFVTRNEYLRWPLIGTIMGSTGMVGLDRGATKNLKEATDRAAAYLAEGNRLCSFLEGTSTGGDGVLAFRTPMVRAACQAGVPVVPVAMRWTAMRPGVDRAEDIAYWKDHVFGSHLFRFAGVGPFELEITLGLPIDTRNRTPREVAGEARAAIIAMTGLCAEDNLGWTSPPAQGKAPR